MALDPSFIGRGYPPTPPYPVSRKKIAEFAGAIGDPDPIYRDPAVAAAAGYPDVIAPPTFAVTVIQSAFESVAADPGLGLDRTRMVHGEQGFRYHRPIMAGDRVRVTTSVEDITSRRDSEFLSLNYEVTTVAGEPVLTATALLVFRPEARS